MYANAQPLTCGNCGEKHFEVSAIPGVLLVQCIACKSISEVKPSAPKLEISFGEGAQGCLAPSSAVAPR